MGEIHCQHYVDNRDGSQVPRTTKPAMARDIIRHAGDLVAMVVAGTRQQALDALELIEVDYEPLDAVVDVYEATAQGAPQLYDCYPNNTVFSWEAGTIDTARAEIDKAVAAGAKLVEVDVINSRVMPNAIETRPMVAQPCEDINGLRMWWHTRTGWPVCPDRQSPEYGGGQIQLLTGDVGGGFGYKIFLHPEQLCIAWAARTLGQTVRWQQDRSDSYLSDLHGRDNRTKARAAVDEMSKILPLMCWCTPIWAPGCQISAFISRPCLPAGR